MLEKEDKEFILKLVNLYIEGSRAGIIHHKIFHLVTDIIEWYTVCQLDIKTEEKLEIKK